MIDSDADSRVAGMVAVMRQVGIQTDRIPPSVPVEVNGGTILVRPMTAADRVKLFLWGKANQVGDDVPPDLAERCVASLYCSAVCDDRGRLVHSLEDIDAVLLTINRDTVQAVAVEAARINRIAESAALADRPATDGGYPQLF